MNSKFYFLPIIILCAGLNSKAGVSGGPELLLPTYVDGTCIHDTNDPFEPNVRVERGPLEGLCVNPLQRRSAKILTGQEAAKYFEPRAGHVVVANFSHQGQFWVAHIPVERAAKMILQVEYFPIGFIRIAHTQYRIDFEEGTFVDLISQSQKSEEDPQRLQLKRLIFSVENIGPYGEKFDAIKGLKKHYNLAYRLVSLDDKYDWMIRQQSHEVKQFLLKLQPQDVSRFLKRALDEADRWSTRRSYHTFNPNCVTELFVLLDEVMGIYNEYIPQIPNHAPYQLNQRGLIDATVNYPTLNEEYEKLN